MGRVVDLKTTRVWVLDTIASATLASVTLSEITAGRDITLQILPSSKLPSYDADKTTEEYNIAQGDAILAPTGTSYSGSLDIFRDFTAGVASTTDLLEGTTPLFAGLFEQKYIVIRDGLPYTTAAANAQKVEVYQVTCGTPGRKRGLNTGFKKATVPLYSLGNANEHASLAT